MATTGGRFPDTGAPIFMVTLGERITVPPSLLVARALRMCGPTVKPLAAESTIAELNGD